MKNYSIFYTIYFWRAKISRRAHSWDQGHVWLLYAKGQQLVTNTAKLEHLASLYEVK